MRPAIVCSWLNQYGGAERVLEAVHELWPQAPIYTSVYEPAALPERWRSWDIRPSWLNRMPRARQDHRLYLPFYPLAFSAMHLSGYDAVLSVSSGFASAVRVSGAAHICYCLTPPRFLWGFQGYVEREGLTGWRGLPVRLLLPLLRKWDRRAMARVEHVVAISQEVRRRIELVYGRRAPIIYPPVEVGRFRLQREPGGYFLVLSRLVPYKRVDLAVRACSRLGLPLRVVGEGRARPALERIAGPTVRFLGWLPDEAVVREIEGCRALILPGLEDFGITPVEALAAGRPVVAFAGGGALETIVDGETGVLFREQSEESLIEALLRLDSLRFEPGWLRQQALRFDKPIFQSKLRELVESCLRGEPIGEGTGSWS